MLQIKAKLKVARAAYKVEVKGRIALAFAERAKSGVHAKLESGEEVALNLPAGEVLRGGDLVTASDGRVIEVVSRPERLFQVESPDLAQVAYRLGERHAPVQFGAAFLRVAADPALEEVLRNLGAKLSTVEAPFEPEAAVSDGDHVHAHDEHCGHDHPGHAHPHHHHYESK